MKRGEWTDDLIDQVRAMAARKMPLALIARELGCSQVEVAQMAAAQNIALTFVPAKPRKPVSTRRPVNKETC
jgi:hypothetical protein